MSGRKTLGFTFYVELPLQIKGTPKQRPVYNSLDHIGDLVSIDRIPGETNEEYKARMYDKSVHLGGADYEGVLNEIGRNLGFLRKEAFVIELKMGSDGRPLAPSPNIEMLANKIIMYSDWRPDGTRVIDKEIRTYQNDDPGFYLNGLASEINESEFFSAYIIDGTRRNSFTSCLVRRNALIRVPVDYVSADKLNKLDEGSIVLSSLEFDEKDIFKTEVFNVEPSASGEYTVDYVEGTVLSYDTPSGDFGCGYHFTAFPLSLDISPVQLFSLQDENFTTELFTKEELDSGEEVNALPNEEGAEVFHQLFMNTKVFWGE